MQPYDALVLAGGSARRLGGVDKPGLLVGGSSLLDRVLSAVTGAGRVVVVGPRRPTATPVRWVREDPPGGGPAAALAAGLPVLQAEWVAVLAADLPFLDVVTVDRLRAAAMDGDGALLVDQDGRDQLLLGVWRTAALRDALPAHPAGARIAVVLDALRAVRLPVAAAGPGAHPWQDVDTDEDLSRARALAGGAA